MSNTANLRGVGGRFLGYMRDGRVPLWRKLAGLLAIVYFLSPVDVIPDFIPVLGWLDDIGVLSAAAMFLVREVQRWSPAPPEVDGIPRDEEGRPRLPSPGRHAS